MHTSGRLRKTHGRSHPKTKKNVKNSAMPRRPISTSGPNRTKSHKLVHNSNVKRQFSQLVDEKVAETFASFLAQKETFSPRHYRDYVIDTISTQHNMVFSPLERAVLHDDSLQISSFHSYLEVKLTKFITKQQQSNPNNSNPHLLQKSLDSLRSLPYSPWTLPAKAIPSLAENVSLDASAMFDRITALSSLIDECVGTPMKKQPKLTFENTFLLFDLAQQRITPTALALNHMSSAHPDVELRDSFLLAHHRISYLTQFENANPMLLRVLLQYAASDDAQNVSKEQRHVIIRVVNSILDSFGIHEELFDDLDSNDDEQTTAMDQSIQDHSSTTTSKRPKPKFLSPDAWPYSKLPTLVKKHIYLIENAENRTFGTDIQSLTGVNPSSRKRLSTTNSTDSAAAAAAATTTTTATTTTSLSPSSEEVRRTKRHEFIQDQISLMEQLFDSLMDTYYNSVSHQRNMEQEQETALSQIQRSLRNLTQWVDGDKTITEAVRNISTDLQYLAVTATNRSSRQKSTRDILRQHEELNNIGTEPGQSARQFVPNIRPLMQVTLDELDGLPSQYLAELSARNAPFLSNVSPKQDTGNSNALSTFIVDESLQASDKMNSPSFVLTNSPEEYRMIMSFVHSDVVRYRYYMMYHHNANNPYDTDQDYHASHLLDPFVVPNLGLTSPVQLQGRIQRVNQLRKQIEQQEQRLGIDDSSHNAATVVDQNTAASQDANIIHGDSNSDQSTDHNARSTELETIKKLRQELDQELLYVAEEEDKWRGIHHLRHETSSVPHETDIFVILLDLTVILRSLLASTYNQQQDAPQANAANGLSYADILARKSLLREPSKVKAFIKELEQIAHQDITANTVGEQVSTTTPYNLTTLLAIKQLRYATDEQSKTRVSDALRYYSQRRNWSSPARRSFSLDLPSSMTSISLTGYELGSDMMQQEQLLIDLMNKLALKQIQTEQDDAMFQYSLAMYDSISSDQNSPLTNQKQNKLASFSKQTAHQELLRQKQAQDALLPFRQGMGNSDGARGDNNAADPEPQGNFDLSTIDSNSFDPENLNDIRHQLHNERQKNKQMAFDHLVKMSKNVEEQREVLCQNYLQAYQSQRPNESFTEEQLAALKQTIHDQIIQRIRPTVTTLFPWEKLYYAKFIDSTIDANAVSNASSREQLVQTAEQQKAIQNQIEVLLETIAQREQDHVLETSASTRSLASHPQHLMHVQQKQREKNMTTFGVTPSSMASTALDQNQQPIDDIMLSDEQTAGNDEQRVSDSQLMHDHLHQSSSSSSSSSLEKLSSLKNKLELRYQSSLDDFKLPYQDVEISTYLPLPYILHSMFFIFEQLFGLEIEQVPTQFQQTPFDPTTQQWNTNIKDVWERNVLAFKIYDAQSPQRTELGEFYLDLFDRSSKSQSNFTTFTSYKYHGIDQYLASNPSHDETPSLTLDLIRNQRFKHQSLFFLDSLSHAQFEHLRRRASDDEELTPLTPEEFESFMTSPQNFDIDIRRLPCSVSSTALGMEQFGTEIYTKARTAITKLAHEALGHHISHSAIPRSVVTLSFNKHEFVPSTENLDTVADKGYLQHVHHIRQYGPNNHNGEDLSALQLSLHSHTEQHMDFSANSTVITMNESGQHYVIKQLAQDQHEQQKWQLTSARNQAVEIHNSKHASTPSLLSMEDVQMLFHEFGHVLHGMLQKKSYFHTSAMFHSVDLEEIVSHVCEQLFLHDVTTLPDGSSVFPDISDPSDTSPIQQTSPHSYAVLHSLSHHYSYINHGDIAHVFNMYNIDAQNDQKHYIQQLSELLETDAGQPTMPKKQFMSVSKYVSNYVHTKNAPTWVHQLKNDPTISQQSFSNHGALHSTASASKALLMQQQTTASLNKQHQKQDGLIITPTTPLIPNHRLAYNYGITVDKTSATSLFAIVDKLNKTNGRVIQPSYPDPFVYDKHHRERMDPMTALFGSKKQKMEEAAPIQHRFPPKPPLSLLDSASAQHTVAENNTRHYNIKQALLDHYLHDVVYIGNGELFSTISRQSPFHGTQLGDNAASETTSSDQSKHASPGVSHFVQKLQQSKQQHELQKQQEQLKQSQSCVDVDYVIEKAYVGETFANHLSQLEPPTAQQDTRAKKHTNLATSFTQMFTSSEKLLNALIHTQQQQRHQSSLLFDRVRGQRELKLGISNLPIDPDQPEQIVRQSKHSSKQHPAALDVTQQETKFQYILPQYLFLPNSHRIQQRYEQQQQQSTMSLSNNIYRSLEHRLSLLPISPSVPNRNEIDLLRPPQFGTSTALYSAATPTMSGLGSIRSLDNFQNFFGDYAGMMYAYPYAEMLADNIFNKKMLQGATISQKSPPKKPQHVHEFDANRSVLDDDSPYDFDVNFEAPVNMILSHPIMDDASNNLLREASGQHIAPLQIPSAFSKSSYITKPTIATIQTHFNIPQTLRFRQVIQNLDSNDIEESFNRYIQDQ